MISLSATLDATLEETDSKRAVLPSPIRTLELAAWDFDEYGFRPGSLDREKQERARRLVAGRPSHQAVSALCDTETTLLREPFHRQNGRPDLHTEMQGLDWTFGVVDLRQLLAFQRRLSFNPAVPVVTVPRHDDWDSLLEIAFASPNPVVCDLIHDAGNKTVLLQSSNPNLHLRVTQDATAPIAVHAGSPFFEVARYAGRWFLRDGYHRAYTLLRAGIFKLPAVIVKARTLAELGAVQPQFFSERTLLSEHPPFVRDFLEDNLTLAYDRPPTIKTLRVTMEESLAPAIPPERSGE